MSTENAGFPSTLEEAYAQTDLMCYGYGERTGEYTGPASGDISPVDFEQGVIHIAWPRLTTRAAPPEIPPGQVAVFDVVAQTWSLLPNHRGETWYHGAVAIEVADLGDPAGFNPPLSKDPPKPEPPPVAEPTSCTRLGLKRAFGDRWPAVRDFINSDEDRKEEWALATEVNVSDRLVQDAIAHFQMSADEVKALIRAAVAAVAPAIA